MVENMVMEAVEGNVRYKEEVEEIEGKRENMQGTGKVVVVHLLGL